MPSWGYGLLTNPFIYYIIVLLPYTVLLLTNIVYYLFNTISKFNPPHSFPFSAFSCNVLSHRCFIEVIKRLTFLTFTLLPISFTILEITSQVLFNFFQLLTVFFFLMFNLWANIQCSVHMSNHFLQLHAQIQFFATSGLNDVFDDTKMNSRFGKQQFSGKNEWKLTVLMLNPSRFAINSVFPRCYRFGTVKELGIPLLLTVTT